MTQICFTVAGVPQPKGSARAFMRPGGRFPIVTSDNPKVKAWQRAIALGALAARGAGQTLERGAVELEIVFYLPRPQRLLRKITPPHLTRPDLDKCIRAVGDALTGVLWGDDGQVTRVVATKVYAEAGAQARATITVRSVESALFAHRSHLQPEAVQ